MIRGEALSVPLVDCDISRSYLLVIEFDVSLYQRETTLNLEMRIFFSSLFTHTIVPCMSSTLLL